jgi:hypothetical protein
MSVGAVQSQNYFVQLFATLRHSAIQLVRAPSHSQRAEAARRLARHALLLTAILSICVIALMIFLDAREIALMPGAARQASGRFASSLILAGTVTCC